MPNKRGFNDFFPLLKWRRLFKSNGIQFEFFPHHLKKKVYDCDIFLIDYFYYQFLFKGVYSIPGNPTFEDESFIIKVIEEARKTAKSIVLFDTFDGGGGATFNITPFVDIHLKKQILKDFTFYTERKEYNLMIWLPKGKGLKETKMLEFTPLKSEDKHKIRLGWNIGLLDYRYFPFKAYYPVGTSNLLNSAYKKLKVRPPSASRPHLLSYRGNSNKHVSYDYQRNLALKKLNEIKKDGLISGPKIPYDQYIKEQQNSKITLSPFGWGEICYRDFESILNGSLLLKPRMNHLVTYPDIYKENETYIPTQWDFEDLEEKINQIEKFYEDYIPYILHLQNTFLEYQNDGLGFVKHFVQALDIHN